MKNLERADVMFERIVHINRRSAGNSGVMKYAIVLLGDVVGKEVTEKYILGGADNWKEYSYGGCALIYDVDICRRLCTPSEIKKTKNGERRPNKHETWMDVQARAVYQAARLIMKIRKEVEK